MSTDTMNIIVQTTAAAAHTGHLIIGDARFPCTLGRNGVTVEKTEGDGKTPIGTYPLRYLFYRADRLEAPKTGLPLEVLTPETGWCEDPAHPDYNRRVVLPHAAVVDEMTREDHLYDLTVVVGHNDDPVVPGAGSAIFIHLARPAFTGTEGCVGLNMDDFIVVLSRLTAESHITILPPPDLG